MEQGFNSDGRIISCVNVNSVTADISGKARDADMFANLTAESLNESQITLNFESW